MDKTKRPTSAWAQAISEHMKGGGKWPKKGTDDYEACKKIADAKKAAAPAKAEAPAKEVPVKAAPTKEASVKVKAPKVIKEAPKEVEKDTSSDESEAVAEPIVIKKAKKALRPIDVPEPVVVDKKKRGPYKRKVVEAAAPVETHTPAPAPAPTPAPAALHVSQTIPLARLQSGGFNTFN